MKSYTIVSKEIFEKLYKKSGSSNIHARITNYININNIEKFYFEGRWIVLAKAFRELRRYQLGL